ncbi:MAG: efflux RND transporter permease subunit [Deltaproteobacteria bacterium]|nr:MAG: efflux RND transporter permease subunit [Deltaproteobacteria bacterium]
MATHEPRGPWETGIGWFIDNRLVVFLLTVMLIVGGLSVSPFDTEIGALPRDPVPVDAIPDIGENQQIVFTTWPGRSPRDVEDQVTYPLTTALLGIPGVRTVRSSSALGFSTIYVIFDDSVDFYWSRSRVLEKLASLPPGTVPDSVTPTLGPDATALGQIFWYTLEGRDPDGKVVGGWDPDELRSIQDWTVRYALQSVEGVSEVASIGGFVREYQVDVDPESLRAHGVSIGQVANAVRRSNLDVGARTMEINRVEYLIRGLGFVESLEDLEQTVVVAREHTPIRIRDVARVTEGPALRRGALDDAGAPAVGGVVVARYLENPRRVIANVQDRIEQIQQGLPRRTLEDGTVSQVTIVPFYDRTTLIDETLGTLSTSLYQQILITIIVVLVMLRNLRSSVLISAILPLGVLGTFIVMKATGVDANIMALGGIAIAIGTMVDIGIVFVENIEQHLEGVEGESERAGATRRAAAEVAPAVLTSVLTTIVSFLPVFGLTATELRLFAPLAFTKTFAMSAALLISLVLIPGAALVVLRKRPGPPAAEATGVQRLVRSAFRATHLRDWLLIAAGCALLPSSWLGGLLVLGLGLWRLVRPLVSEPTTTRGTLAENVLTILVVTVLLTRDWLPLGPGNGLVLNLLFVGGIIAAVLGGFRFFERSYGQALDWVLTHKKTFLLGPLAIALFGSTAWLGFDTVFGFVPQVVRTTQPVAAVAHAFPGFGREYMPPFDEGSYLYMPTTMPHASMGEALDMLSTMDAAIAQIPEVDRVVGKLGRADSALDPAPISMVETIITYHPEYRTEADGTRVRQWRDHIRTPRDIWTEITKAAELPGVTSAPVLMPINARIVMLQSGMRAPLGIKVKGPSLEAIEAFGFALEEVLKEVPAVRAETVFADRVVGKPYLEIDLDREAIGRYGLTVVDVQEVLQIALGGMTLTRTVEGRERYPIRVRYMREDRDSVEALQRLSVPTPSGAAIPLTQLAEIRYERGPQVIKAEDTFLTSYVLFDRVPEVAEVEVVEQASAVIREQLASGALVLPDGVSFEFAGSYENQVRSEQRLMVLIPVALCMVFILLYLQFKRVETTAIIYSGVVVAVSGGFGLLWLYGQPWFLDFALFGMPMRDLFQVGTVNLSVAVWIGVIALIGIATDDGVVMATYLKQVFERDPPRSVAEVRARTLEAGSRRVRPCLMTTATTVLALLPVVTSQGRGADVMVPLALPALGGMAIELITLFVVPVLYCAVEEWRLSSATE